jgi:DNA polymerase III delta prime subunit
VCPDLVLLQGPPGTGKTTTLVQVLRAIMARPECARVLVCAPSNRGVQEVLERFLAAVAAAGSRDKDAGNGDGGGGETAAESCGEGTRAAQGSSSNNSSSSSSKGGGQGPAAGTGEESWRWCCRAGRWIPPGGDGEGGGTASICEEDVALVGDADKVPHGSSSARVFVHWIEDHWAAELRRVTESLRQLASRLDGEVEDGEIEDDEDAAAPDGKQASRDGPFVFCSRADLACKIRISHTERCAASADALLRLLTDASNVVASVRKGMQRRMPYTLKQSGAALEKGLAESTRSLALALSELNGGRGRWPCTLAGRASHIAGAMSGAATALSAASLGLVELREASRQEDRALEMLGSARLVFCTLTVSGSYL